MWSKPWGMGEGAAISGGLIVAGLAIQLSAGAISWELLAWPINIVLLCLFIVVLVAFYAGRNHSYFIRWALTYRAAVPALAAVAIVTFVMGVTKQDDTSHNMLRRMLRCWPFVLTYIWMAVLLGLAVVRGVCQFRWRRLPSLLNHTGLFVALLCGTLGSADMQRLTMNARMGQAEWRAVDGQAQEHELPLAIELQAFSIDEYPPKLMMIDNATGGGLPEGRPEQLSMDSVSVEGSLCGWQVRVEQLLEYAASTPAADTIRYVEWPTVGATNAAYIVLTRGDQRREGWVSCGSFLFPYQALRIDSLTSVVMPDREPRRYCSEVKIYTQKGTICHTTIEVNRPATVEGWKVYQLSYDQVKGRWSDMSVFELVRDPWLPGVYVGIFLLIAGAISMFITAGRPAKRMRSDDVE